MFSSFGQTFFISLSTGHVRSAFDLTSGEYGSIYMVATLASALTLTFFGRIVDHYSIATTTILSTLLLAVACIGFAQANSLAILVLSIYGLRLLGQGMMTHIALTAMGRWYAQNRGKAVSIVSVGFNAGLAILPIAFIGVVEMIGWRHTWLVCAAILIVVAMPAITLLLRQERTAQNIVQTTHDARPVYQWTTSQMLRDPIFWVAIIFLLGPPFIGTAIFFHQDYLFQLRGWSLNLFAWTFVLMTLTSVLAGLISGIAIDKFSAVSLLPLFLFPLGLGCMVLALIPSSSALIIYMVLLGISTGINASIYGSIWPEIYGTKNLGSIRSLITAMMVFSSALGPGVVGWAIDLQIHLSVQLMVMAAFCTFGTLALLACSIKYKQRKLDYLAA